MLNQHSDVGIATIVFYVPAVVLSAYLLLYRHRRPRMAWYFMFMFSLVRVASGAVVILYENKPKSVGLTIAAIILLGVGVMPLIAVTIGMLRIIIAKSFSDDFLLPKLVIISRMIFLISVILLIVGGVYVGQFKDPKESSLGLKLVRAGYVVAVVLLAYLITFQAILWSQKRRLDRSSKIILTGTNFAMLFLSIRITYAMLAVFEPANLKWNNLSGSIGVFVTMNLLMEYGALAAWLCIGFMIPQIKSTKTEITASRTTETIHREVVYSQETLLQKVQRRWNERD